MIIFGWRSKLRHGERVGDVACPNCGGNTHRAYALIKYFHVYWIPTFVYSRELMIECQSCHRVVRGPGVGSLASSDLVGKVRRGSFEPRRLLPYFSGALAVVALVTIGGLSSTQSAAWQSNYLSDPHVRDLYAVDLRRVASDVKADDEFPYALLQVQSVSGDKVVARLGGQAYSSRSGPEKAISSHAVLMEGYFMPSPLIFTVGDLRRLQ